MILLHANVGACCCSGKRIAKATSRCLIYDAQEVALSHFFHCQPLMEPCELTHLLPGSALSQRDGLAHRTNYRMPPVSGLSPAGRQSTYCLIERGITFRDFEAEQGGIEGPIPHKVAKLEPVP